jgi:hypothetical protein
MTIGVMMNPPKFDGSMSWTVFHRQFEAMTDYSGWAAREKVTNLLDILQGQAADILKCPSWSDVRGYHRGAEGPLQGPQAGGNLVFTTHS